jgi:hypothetical protein
MKKIHRILSKIVNYLIETYEKLFNPIIGYDKQNNGKGFYWWPW